MRPVPVFRVNHSNGGKIPGTGRDPGRSICELTRTSYTAVYGSLPTFSQRNP